MPAIFVKKNYRRMRLGSKLVKHLQAVATEKGIGKIVIPRMLTGTTNILKRQRRQTAGAYTTRTKILINPVARDIHKGVISLRRH